MKLKTEIQLTHDTLSAALDFALESHAPDAALMVFNVARSVLCWVLEHKDESAKQFESILKISTILSMVENTNETVRRNDPTRN